MQAIHLQYEKKIENEAYRQASYENACKKLFMELDLLYTKSKALPIMLTDFPSLICYSTLPGTLESYMYVENLKLEPEKINRSVKTHEAFITLYALNNLRKLRVPNFEYYHAVIENKFDEDETCENFFVISENYLTYRLQDVKTFKQILQQDSYENILAYFVSILFALQTANVELSYTHYNLTPENIQMRYISDKTFECEYMLNNCLYTLNLYKYLPVILNNEKAYVKIQVDENMRSFGYNDVNEIPFETKGIYTDRGFVITDTYRLLVNMLKITKKYNTKVFERLYELFEYFEGCHSETDYLPYCDRTNLLNLKEFIEYILKRNDFLLSGNFSELNSEKFYSKNNILTLRSIGYELKLKPKSIAYYSVKNIIQLYDFLKFYSHFMNDSNTELINSLIEKGVEYYIEYFEEENLEQARKEISEFKKAFRFFEKGSNFNFENSELLKVPKISKDCIEYINTLQNFMLNWNKIKLYSKIFGFLSYSNPEYESLYNEYESLILKYKNSYDFSMKKLLNFRNIFRNNLDLYCIYKNQILILETLE